MRRKSSCFSAVFAMLCILVLFVPSVFAFNVDFEGVTLPFGYYNGADGAGGFVADNQFFASRFDPQWYSWENVGCSGLAVSSAPEPPIIENGAADWSPYYASIFPDREFSSITGSGDGASTKYAILFPGFSDGMAHITFQQPVQVDNISLTNTNYTYHALRDGNQYSTAFGEGDYYCVTITGRDIFGNVTGSLDYYLADYRDGKTLIVNDWQQVDLSGLGTHVKSLDFNLTSTDQGQWGSNTPGYFALDDIDIAGNPLGASWSGSANSAWSLAANWNGDLPTLGQSLLFDSADGGISTNDGSATPTAGAITFGSQAGSFTLSGNAVELQYDLSNLSTNVQTVDLPLVLVGGKQSILTALGDLVISKPISEDGGSFGLTKTGSKTLTLSASNSYTGPTIVQEGVLLLAAGGDISAASEISVAAGAVLEIGEGSHVLGTIAGGGKTVVVSDATLTAVSITQDTLTIGSAPMAAVPEPGTLFLLLSTVMAIFCVRGKFCG